ncbi:MAG: hypothetical protein KJ062_14910 [Thermoanaerobaculia bacterium]|nr:hypothetical protein [Thermoanaerobaculia bacterium]
MTSAPRRPSASLLVLASLVLAILVAASILVGRVARMPGEMAGAIPRAARETATALSDGLARLATAIRMRSVTTEFTSTATEVRGTKRLQVAELSQVEVVERRDATRLFGIPLPDVVVSARAPVTYVYVLDLDGRWEFDLAGRTVSVLAPDLSWNAPAVDVSALTFVKAETSILRDEDRVLEELRASLTGIFRQRARQGVPLVRETARRQAEEFVRAWLLRAYGVPEDVRVVVRFRGEPTTIGPASPLLPPRG